MRTYGNKIRVDLRRAFTEMSKEKINKVQKEIIEDIWEGLVESTPVDTGRARAHWDIVLKGAPGKQLPILYGGQSQEEMDKIGAYRDERKTRSNMFYDRPKNHGNPEFFRDENWLKNPVDVDIVNACEYIDLLNEGHSDQAPKMFVQGTISMVLGRAKTGFKKGFGGVRIGAARAAQSRFNRLSDRDFERGRRKFRIGYM